MAVPRLHAEPDACHGCPDPAAVRLRVRLQTILDALSVLEGVAPGDDLLGPIRLACETLVPGTGGGEVIPLFRMALPADLARFEHDLDRVEQAILTADAAIPMLLFRKRFDAGDLPRPAIARYAALLAENLGSDAERRDRVELLVTRMVSFEGDDGRVHLHDRSRVFARLRQVAGGRRLDPAARSRVLRFIAEQGERLAGFRDADALFESGFHANVYGYKLALRDQMLDPEVLYGIAWLNAQVTNFHRAHAPASERAIHARVQEVRREVHGVLETGARLSRSETTRRFEALRVKARARDRELERLEWIPTKRFTVVSAPPEPFEMPWRRVARWVAVAIIVVGGITLGRNYRATHRFHRIPDVQAETMAPWVLHASLGPGDAALVGAVDPQAWHALDPKARRAGAQDLAQLLASDGTRSAVLTSNGRLAIQIDGGRVVYVQ